MEPFEAAELRERQWDENLARLPQCSRCGRHIVEDSYFQYENICLCQKCLEDCMVMVDW